MCMRTKVELVKNKQCCGYFNAIYYYVDGPCSENEFLLSNYWHLCDQKTNKV